MTFDAIMYVQKCQEMFEYADDFLIVSTAHQSLSDSIEKFDFPRIEKWIDKKKSRMKNYRLSKKIAKEF